MPSDDAIPPPPYQLRGCTFLMLGAEFDAVTASRLVPPELEVVDEATGGFYFYTAPRGWGVAPYTATLAWIDIKGHDSADGSHGRYMVFGGYSGVAYQAFKYNKSVVEGYASISETGEVIEGVGGPDGSVYLRIGARKTGGEPIAADGTHYYIAPMRAGGICLVPAAFSYDFNAATPDYLTIDAPPDTAFGMMQPKNLTWAGWITNGVITIGQESAIVDRPGAENTMASAMYLNFLTQIGKGAIAIKRDDTIVFQNDAAEKLAGDGFYTDRRRFRVSERARGIWEAAKGEALQSLESRWSLQPIGLPRSNSSTPLIVQILPYRDVLVILITDPEQGLERQPYKALQILGLTPAEARIGVLIAEGLEAKSVAERLGNSVSTVRSTMRQIYDKLGIRKQSELSYIVAKLGSVGV